MVRIRGALSLGACFILGNVVNREELHDAGYVIAIKRKINPIFAANMVQLLYSDMI